MKYLESLLLASLAVFMPIKAAMITISILILVDLVTGVWAAIKRKEKITSAGLRRTVSKVIIYELGIATGFLVEAYLLSGLLPVSKMIGALIGITEFKSISENMDGIVGENLFKMVLQKLGSTNEIEEKIKDQE